MPYWLEVATGGEEVISEAETDVQIAVLETLNHSLSPLSFSSWQPEHLFHLSGSDPSPALVPRISVPISSWENEICDMAEG